MPRVRSTRISAVIEPHCGVRYSSASIPETKSLEENEGGRRNSTRLACLSSRVLASTASRDIISDPFLSTSLSLFLIAVGLENCIEIIVTSPIVLSACQSRMHPPSLPSVATYFRQVREQRKSEKNDKRRELERSLHDCKCTTCQRTKNTRPLIGMP